MTSQARLTIRPTPRVLNAALSTPWAITEEKLGEISSFLSAYAQGIRVSEADLAAMREARQARAGVVASAPSVGVLRIHGTIFPRANVMFDFSGGASLEVLTKELRAFAADPAVHTIVLDVDSPGGSTAGVMEFAALVGETALVKPIVAVANHLMASAAYWIGSQATELVASPSADVGSIGVLMLHLDESRAWEEAGITPTLFRAGRLKGLGNPFEPLDEEARSLLQARVDESYDDFIAAVARGRRVKPQAVRSGFGEGRLVYADEARTLGMVDRVESLDETLARVGRPSRSRSNSARALALQMRIKAAATMA